MPVTWGIRGPVLTLSVSEVVTNQDIASAIDEALASAPGRSGMRLLWDARDSQTPVSSDDLAWRFELVSSLAERGILSRAALLLPSGRGLILELARLQMPKAIPSLQFKVFGDASEALAWLEE